MTATHIVFDTAETVGVDSADFRAVPPADLATCPSCVAELFDPGSPRYHYPFVTCRECGPRFTVIRSMPYARERTSMAGFEPCPSCLAEYHTPGGRRYQSESVSCPRCGPRLWYVSADGATGDGDLIGRAADLLLGGGILAVKGLGGFQLAIDATNATAVARLRRRLVREAEPLAVMVGSLDAAGTIAEIDAAAAAMLVASERPVVLVPAPVGSSLAAAVNPGLRLLGLMLPSTPIHHLLLDRVSRPLVITGGRRSNEPIAIKNDDAIDRLADIADGFLLHDREIVSGYDESVVRSIDGTPLLVRRARGFAPSPLRLPVPSPVGLVALGPHHRNTFTLVDRGRAVVSQHIGDLANPDILARFKATLTRYRELFGVEPEAVAHDLNPACPSSRMAAQSGLPAIAVQHHHAHIAAVLAEHGEVGSALGVAYDNSGHGEDGNIWGSEVLSADLVGYRRLAHLRYAPMPGGRLVARSPWRAALGYAWLAGLGNAWRWIFDTVDPTELATARAQLEEGVDLSLSSSMGRLFDAAAAVIGIRMVSQYEGQAAMELEALAGRRPGGELISHLSEQDGIMIVDPVPLLINLAWQRDRGVSAADLAADFHASVAWITEQVVRRAAEATGLRTVAFGGGVFLNGRLLSSLRHRLEAARLRVLLPMSLGPNDGAVSYGQAAVAAARLARGGFPAEATA